MEIQQIGSIYNLTDLSHQNPKLSPTPNETFLRLSQLPPKKILHNLPRTKKYASRPRILERQSLLPQEKKKLSILSANQLSKKKLLEAEIFIEDIENPNLLHSLAKAFKKLDSAKKITLKLTSYGNLHMPAVQWLIWSLSHLKSLTSLTLHIPYHPDYKDGEFLKLLKKFAKNQHLQKFNLVVHIRYGIKSAIVSRLHDVLARIKTLKDVSLNLVLNEYVYRVKPSIMERGLAPRYEQFSSEKLAFSLDVPYFIERKELVNSLAYISCFNSLRRLSLNFSSFIHRLDGRIDDEILSNLLPVFSSHKQLAHLDLSFEMSWYIEENHITTLMKAISRLEKLESLKLNFASCYGVTDQSLKETAIAISKLHNLELISLNFGSCYQITDPSMQFLIHSLARLKSLMRLELILSSCYKLTSTAIEGLQSFESLKALSLNLENCGQMNEKATLCLAKALSRLNYYLETVSLNLSYMMKMTNYEFCVLGASLSGLSGLKYLSLDIGGYRTITESAFINFFRKLGALKKLLGLVLNLRYDSLMSDRALSTLSIITCGFQELRELKIDLIGAELLTEKCYPKLVKVFAKFEDSKKVEIFI